MFRFNRSAKKLASFLFAGSVATALVFNCFNSMSVQDQMVEVNATCVEKVSENSVKLSKGTHDSVIFTKECGDSKFYYKMKNAESGEDLGSFSSEIDIDLNSNSTRNLKDKKFYAAAWALVTAIMNNKDPAQEVMLVISGATNLARDPNFVAACQLAGECGILAIPSIIGLLTMSEAIVIGGGLTLVG
jgi:hypothetical protein